MTSGQTPKIQPVFAPVAHQAVQEIGATRTALWLTMLDDLAGRLVSFTHEPGGRWLLHAVSLPDNATLNLVATSASDDVAFVSVESFLTPTQLYRLTPNEAPALVQSGPPRFDASAFQVEKRFATSKDGTAIPYFLVRRRDAQQPRPALIHAYGGFGASQTPNYLVDEPSHAGPAALFWVEEGNSYVLAGLRGGAEYGPGWHHQAMREKRQNAYDDLHAVAEDLVHSNISAPQWIAVSGRSNGGLLAGVAMTQRPDLYGAIVCGSPLLDMRRYSHLSAGSSWIGEYGDPNVPADWAFLSQYSPYQNLKPGARYPTPFIYTSTFDDRVDPGHARRFAAKLQDLQAPFFYLETREGGHDASTGPEQQALRAALVTTYLNLELGQAHPAAALAP